MQPDQIVRITAKGKYKGQLARVLPYKGTWCHVEFLNRNINPRDKHFPPGSIEEVSMP